MLIKRAVQFAGVALFCVASLICQAADSRPNIVFIMTDDHAAHAISAYGSKINKTPNIDRIAKEGMLFKNCFAVNAICTPSRAAILTGKYSHKNGVPVFNRFDGSQWTVAKELQKAGYYTGMMGKWHLQSDPTGFDKWEVLPGQGKYHNPDFINSSGRHQVKGYATDIITDMSIDFIEQRPKDKPFFLMFHHKAPHRPWEPDEKHRKMFENVNIPLPKTFDDDYSTRCAAATEAEMRIDRDLNKTDVKMDPFMTGFQLAQCLRLMRVEIKVLYISGFVEDEMVRWEVESGVAAFLQKPFRPQELLEKIRAASA